MNKNAQTNKILNTTVIIAGLGYFVDIYDLQLFNIIGKESIMSPIGRWQEC